MTAEELEAVIRMADEDTTLLGEQLAALGVESAGVDLAEVARRDYQGALDADTPYWQAGDALLPYGKDWFTTGMLEGEANRRNMGGGLGAL